MSYCSLNRHIHRTSHQSQQWPISLLHLMFDLCTLITSHFSLIRPPYSRWLCNILGDCAIFCYFFFTHIHSWIKSLSTRLPLHPMPAGHTVHTSNNTTHIVNRKMAVEWQSFEITVSLLLSEKGNWTNDMKADVPSFPAGGRCSTAGPEPTNPNKWWRGGVRRARGAQHYDHWIVKGSSAPGTLPWKRQEHPGQNVSKGFSLFLS